MAGARVVPINWDLEKSELKGRWDIKNNLEIYI